YDLSRRLFLMRGDDADLGRFPAQKQLLAWATGIFSEQFSGPGQLCADGNCGRPNMDPIMAQFGFVTCTPDPFDTPVPPNLCAVNAPAFLGPTCQLCTANGGNCTVDSACCSGTCSNGTCNPLKGSGAACANNAECLSGQCGEFGATPDLICL